MSRRSRANSARRAADRGHGHSTQRRIERRATDAGGDGSRERPWKVISVFDPEGTGGDFGYTVGLVEFDHPELHMWARPTHGADPGADFKLSPQDVCVILNHYADVLLAGELSSGNEFSRQLDAGMTEARITVGEAVHPTEVEAFGVQPGVDVLPLRWELLREPEGCSAPVSPSTARTIERVACEWRLIVEDLGGSMPIGSPDTDHGQRYGPWTPAIEAVRDAVRIVGATGELSWCIDALAERTPEIGHSIALAAALARRHGRTKAFDAASAAARADGEAAITRDDSIWVDMNDEEIEQFLPRARYLMELVLSACYSHLVMLEHIVDFDGIDSDLVTEVQRVVLAVVRQAAYPTGTIWPDEDWPDAG